LLAGGFQVVEAVLLTLPAHPRGDFSPLKQERTSARELHPGDDDESSRMCVCVRAHTSYGLMIYSSDDDRHI